MIELNIEAEGWGRQQYRSYDSDGTQLMVQIWRWICPLRACDGVFESLTEDDARDAFLPGGAIHAHIHSHDLLEWAQEVIDLRRGADG